MKCDVYAGMPNICSTQNAHEYTQNRTHTHIKRDIHTHTHITSTNTHACTHPEAHSGVRHSKPFIFGDQMSNQIAYTIDLHEHVCTCRHTDLSEPFKVMYLMAEVKNKVDYEHSTSEGGLKYLQEEHVMHACCACMRACACSYMLAQINAKKSS